MILTKYERETTITFNSKEKYARVFSCQRTVVNYLKSHPEFKVEKEWEFGGVTHISGDILKTCVRFSEKPRKAFALNRIRSD